ncbi:MAG: ABC transporter ATP-binding protein [Desulfobulbaceae bacterium]|nr:ABC transporter ATP-binding protein [Desulfobulbaceae bacterium]
MTKPAISVSKLGKSYRLGMEGKQVNTFQDLLVGMAKAPFNRLKRLGEHHVEADDAFWALKDVSFEVRPGEVVGIIGRNGAGKSTLLKILSRITEPTLGEALLHGRVSSLLEVGTGFHQELTGRENIFLNGSILGMSRAEIKSKFDEIVAFSEIEEFMDTPVKRYSSGMYVRLAFAVAAHLEPEILIVDEVLAVGDLEFQKKCIGKMGEVATEGRTVLIVSHNMSAIQSLCPRSILLRQGKIVDDGKTDTVIKEYLKFLEKGAANPFENNPERKCSGEVKLTGVQMLDEAYQPLAHPISGKPLILCFDYENTVKASRMDVVMTIFNHLGVAVANLNTRVVGVALPLKERGRFSCKIPRLPLPFGDYRIAIALQLNGTNVDLMPNVLAFGVTVSKFYKTGLSPDIQYSSALMDHEWFF